MVRIMQGDGSLQVWVRYIALGALFLIPFTPLIVANSFFFPFITGKAFYFRILVEVAFAAWAVLAASDPRYRPRFSPITIAVLAFVGWMFVANLFAPNVTKAFWSNFERMEGWVLLAHLGMFFFAAGAVLRVEGRWRAWFLTSLGVSIVILGYASLQVLGVAETHQGSTRATASFGNAIYLAAYLLFNTFIALWLAVTEKQQWLKWALVILSVVSGVFIFSTQTRGTVVALVGALGVAALLTLFTKGKQARMFAAGGLVALIIIVGGFIAMRDSDLVRQNSLLNRIAHTSLADGATRFTLWSMALEGVRERPIVGWGQEGFNYVFNQYYRPSLYAQEAWFDRAHNAFIDWLSAGGVPAFILYIALFVVGIWSLYRAPFSPTERTVLISALIGYAIHNVFVFDNLFSYVYFFAILGLIESHLPRPREPKKVEVIPIDFALPIGVVALLMVIWFVNISGIGVAHGLIRALSPQPGGLVENLQIFTELTEPPSFAAQEVREQLVNFALQVVSQNDVPNEVKARVATLAIWEMKKQVAAYPQDARGHLQLSLAYRLTQDIEGIMGQLDAAIEDSPRKQQILIQKGITLIQLSRFAEAKEVLVAAYRLEPRNLESSKYAVISAIAAKDEAIAREILTAHPEIAQEVAELIKRFGGEAAQ